MEVSASIGNVAKKYRRSRTLYLESELPIRRAKFTRDVIRIENEEERSLIRGRIRARDPWLTRP